MLFPKYRTPNSFIIPKIAIYRITRWPLRLLKTDADILFSRNIALSWPFYYTAFFDGTCLIRGFRKLKKTKREHPFHFLNGR